MRLEKTGRLASVFLGVISLFFGAMYPVFVEIGTRGGPDSVFRLYEDFLILYCLTSILTGVLAIMTGRSFKSKFGVIFGQIGIWFSILIFFVVLILSLSIVGSRNQPFRRMETLSSAIQVYCEQNEGHLPDATVWCDQLLKSGENIEELSIEDFLGSHRLGSSACGKSGYIAFNSNLGGYSISDIDRQTVLLFETDLGWNQNGTLAPLPSRSKWVLWPFFEDGDHFVFVGPNSTFTVKFIKKSEIDDLNWEPAEQPVVAE